MFFLPSLQVAAIFFFSSWFKFACAGYQWFFKRGFTGPVAGVVIPNLLGIHLAYFFARCVGWEPFTGSINRFDRP